MQFYLWLRPYQDTGLAAFNHPFIHEHMNEWMIVKSAVLVGLMGMHKTGCSEETRFVLHVPSSS